MGKEEGAMLGSHGVFWRMESSHSPSTDFGKWNLDRLLFKLCHVSLNFLLLAVIAFLGPTVDVFYYK